MNKVLIITYYWPPSGGAGVQRWLRFSKYLPQLGWEPVILTVDPAYATYPAIDKSLEIEVPESIEVFRTKATDWFRFYSQKKSDIPTAGFAKNNENTLKEKLSRFIRGNLFLPDPRRGWNKYAFKKACEIIETSGINHIITTSPPHSTQLIGLKLKKKYPHIKWIADLRDPWTDIYYYKQFYPTPIARKIDTAFETKVLRTADSIITVGKSLKSHFAEKIRGIENKIEVITNGFDENDFAGLSATKTGLFTISYIGTLSDSYPINGFLDALSDFDRKGSNFNLKFVGTVSSAQKDLILSGIKKSSVEFIPYSDHKKAIGYMSESDLLLLIIPDHQSNKSIITGKLFEYIATKKTVICLGPEGGNAADILTSCNAGKSFYYTDKPGILSYLEESLKNWKSGVSILTNDELVNSYSGKSLTARLVQVIQQL
jgi:glycosyltransferase involved in cell wall biosynthesis